MKDFNEQIENEIRTLNYWTIRIGLAVIAAVLIVPFLFTRPWGFLDLTQTGQIGDTLGGITAPFIGLASAALIYISFRAQIRANQIQMKAITEERKISAQDRSEALIWKQYDEVKEVGLKIEQFYSVERNRQYEENFANNKYNSPSKTRILSEPKNKDILAKLFLQTDFISTIRFFWFSTVNIHGDMTERNKDMYQKEFKDLLLKKIKLVSLVYDHGVVDHLNREFTECIDTEVYNQLGDMYTKYVNLVHNKLPIV